MVLGVEGRNCGFVEAGVFERVSSYFMVKSCPILVKGESSELWVLFVVGFRVISLSQVVIAENIVFMFTEYWLGLERA